MGNTEKFFPLIGHHISAMANLDCTEISSNYQHLFRCFYSNHFTNHRCWVINTFLFDVITLLLLYRLSCNSTSQTYFCREGFITDTISNADNQAIEKFLLVGKVYTVSYSLTYLETSKSYKEMSQVGRALLYFPLSPPHWRLSSIPSCLFHSSTMQAVQLPALQLTVDWRGFCSRVIAAWREARLLPAEPSTDRLGINRRHLMSIARTVETSLPQRPISLGLYFTWTLKSNDKEDNLTNELKPCICFLPLST